MLCYGWQAVSLPLTGRYLMSRAWVRRMMQRLTTPSNCKNNVRSSKSCMFDVVAFNWIHAVIIITVELVWKNLKCLICSEVTLRAWCQTFPFIFHIFWFDTQKAVFQVILGLLQLSISVCRLRERGCMSKSVYVHVVHDLELLWYVLCCEIEQQL